MTGELDPLVAALLELLAAARTAAAHDLRADLDPPALLADVSGRASAVPPTILQELTLDLKRLCQRALVEADERTAREFFAILVETAAMHAPRSWEGGRPR